MEYQPSYFEDEVRDGFFVPSIMKKCWASAKKIYDDLQEFCDLQGVMCTVTYGTLMGAIRHGGFIPWDDDLDVMMMRDQLERLMELKQSGKLGKCKIADYTEGKHSDLVRGFTNYEKSSDDLEEHYGFPFGDMIDIFVYDYVPKKSEERETYEKELEILFQKYYQASGLGETIRALTAIEDYCSEYTKEGCDECALIPSWFTRFRTQLFKNQAFAEYLEVPFEMGTVRVPIGYDYILRKLYGNYMNPQIVKSGHGYPFFDSLEKQLWEEYGEKLLRYSYNRKEIKKIRQKNKGKKTLREELMISVDLLREAHRYICDNYQKRELRQSILDTLGQCQELAIHLGEQIEERAVNSTDIVHVLEQYCDVVFCIYQMLSETLSADRSLAEKIKELLDCERKTEELIRNLKTKKEVVFLVYKVEYWKAVHTLWEEFTGRDDTIVTVISVPYYYRKYNGEVEKEMHIEEGYPEEVVLTSYENYNFEIHHPDIVIYQFPYDEYSYALTLHPFYYAGNLRQYVEQMVFVPPYIMRDTVDDERTMYTLRWFLCTPGVIYADKIYAQSEHMKEVYIEILDEFTGRDRKLNWDKRIDASRFPLREWNEKVKRDKMSAVPEEWNEKMTKEDGSRKKVILYYVSVSVLYEYREKALEKMRQLVDIAKKYKDEMLFLWYTDPYIERVMREKMPEIQEMYQMIRSAFQSEGNGILDDSGDYHCVVQLCDAFYGDGGPVMSECRMSGKPVLWENPDVTLAEG